MGNKKGEEGKGLKKSRDRVINGKGRSCVVFWMSWGGKF